MTTQYIGIAGITCLDEAKAVVDVCPAALRQKLVLGLLCSEKSLTTGELSTRSCSLDEMRKIAEWSRTSESGGIRAWPHLYSKKPPTMNRYGMLTDAVGWLDGVQLNVPALFDYKAMIALSNMRRSCEKQDGMLPSVVLQINRSVMDELATSGCGAFGALSLYLASAVNMLSISHVLLDMSAGRGIAADIDEMDRMLMVASGFRELDVGVAGGLGPSRLEWIRPLLKTYPRLSVDMESGVRDTNDLLDIKKVCAVLVELADLISAS